MQRPLVYSLGSEDFEIDPPIIEIFLAEVGCRTNVSNVDLTPLLYLEGDRRRTGKGKCHRAFLKAFNWSASNKRFRPIL